MNTKTENIDDVIRKIKKCFALANDGADSDESDTAMLLAQKLMARYNLSVNDIEYENERIKNVKEGDGTEYVKMQWWMKSLAVIIANNFRCYTYIRHNSGKTKIIFLGLEEDVSICKTVYEFAVVSVRFHSDSYIKKRDISGNRGTTVAIKNDYIAGYLEGLRDKFKEQVEQENLSLILVKDALVVKEYETLKLGKGVRSKRTTNRDSDALTKGYNDGKKFRH